MRRRALTIALLAAVNVALACSPAIAAWSLPSGSSGGATARAAVLPAGATPVVSVSNRDVTVSWSARQVLGQAVSGYQVRRYSATGSLQGILAGCSGTITGLSCTETAVPPGDWRYSVAARHGAEWIGAEGTRTAAAVGAPALTLAQAVVTSLPATVTGTVTSYHPGQALTFRLDDPVNGQVLAATVSPSSVSADGTASVTITIPAGTPNGVRAIHAIGSQGDSAYQTLEVAVPVSSTTTAFDLRDASSSIEADQAHPLAYADARTSTSAAWSTAFATTRYIDYDLNQPLPPGRTLSELALSFRVASPAVNTSCFYFEVRRASTNALIATKGSAATPYGCVTTTTQTTFTVPLPEVLTSDLANDLRIRAYGRNSASAGTVHDSVTVTGTGLLTGPYTLHATTVRDAAAGAAPVVSTWATAAADAANYQVGTGWDTAFSAAKYLRMSFPAYVPVGATRVSATLTHSYRPATNGNSACIYVEVYSGTALVGTHGSAATPISCNSSNATFVTDTVVLPEIDTPAAANSLSVRVYVRTAGNSANQRRTQHDVATVTVSYVV